MRILFFSESADIDEDNPDYITKHPGDNTLVAPVRGETIAIMDMQGTHRNWLVKKVTRLYCPDEVVFVVIFGADNR